MTTFPLVSIVTPSYNQAQFLEQTISSVLGQDYPNLEYLIADGGSTDGSREIIQRHSDRLAWWVSEPDAGQAEAINKGLRRARGEIVAWLNSDDLYLPGAVSQAVEVLNKNPDLGFVYGEAITIDENGKPLGRFRFEEWGLVDLASFRIICQPAVFMRRSVLERAGYLDSSYHYMLDHHLWIRMARLAPVAFVRAGAETSERPLRGLWAAARHHAGAKNVSQAAGFGREIFGILEWMKTQPDLAELIHRFRGRVLSGAYRLNARYLLDGGLPGRSLVSYWQAVRYRPAFGLRHWHRMIYALLWILGLKPLTDRVTKKFFSQKQINLVKTLRETALMPSAEFHSIPPDPYRLVDWPGIQLDL